MRSDVRPLTEKEIESLEQALGRPVDRKYLVYWISQSIRDAIRSASLGTPRQLRDRLLEIEREGREWLRCIDESRAESFLTGRANLPEFRTAAAAFCDRVASLAREVDTLVRPGRARTPAALEAFVERMVGIAKRAKVRPSTPSRRLDRQKSPPAFFRFLLTALRTARRVIKTSPLADDLKTEALSRLQYETRDTLIKLVVKVRGRIGNYREGSRGLVEWE